MTDDTEIAWHREQIAKNRTLLEELEAGNTAGGEVFPETQSEIDHLKAQIAQTSATNSANHGLLVAGLVFSSCVRDSTKPAIRDRSSSMDGMSISSAT
jgi:hypothetical protein